MVAMRRFARAIMFLTLLGLAGAGPQTATYFAKLNTSALAADQTAVLAVVTDIAPGLHAQSHAPLESYLIKFEIIPDPNPAVEFLDPIYPPGTLENFPGLGQQSVYTGRVIVYVPMRIKSNAPVGDTTISGTLTWQACNDTSCFAPQRQQPFTVNTRIIAAGEAVNATDTQMFSGFDPGVFKSSPSSTQPAAASQPATSPPAVNLSSDNTRLSIFGHSLDLKNQSFLVVGMVAFLAGIIFNVVPCVLPVLPVKAIGFYEASQHNRARTILFGLSFSLGLIAVFALLGMLILLSKSLFGHQWSWGEHFSHPIFGWTIAVVLAALGFGMLGAYSLSLPSGIYGLDFRHDTVGGNFMWGALTAVLSTPCTGPLFPPVLAYSQTLPRLFGFLVVVTVGAGMASPYFVLSAFPELARRFPRTGAVSELVKQMMGFLLLATAAFFVGFETLGQPGQWWIIFAVVAWAALYLVVRGAQIFKSPMGLYITTAIAVAMISIALLAVLRLSNVNLMATGMASSDALAWQPYSDAALSAAQQDNRPALIDFTADWCLNCKYVEQTVFHDPRVLDALKKQNVLALKADLTQSDAPGSSLLTQLGGQGIPYTAVYLPGNPKPVGIDSIYTADTLLGVLKRTDR